MTRRYNYLRILDAIRKSPGATEHLQVAEVYAGVGDVELMALHASAAADIITADDPDLGHPIAIAQLLAASLNEAEMAKDRRSLLN